MFPIDHFFLLPILQFIVSFTVYSPAMSDETCLVHNIFLIVYYIQVSSGHIATPQCIKQRDSQLPHSRSMTPTLSVDCLAQVPFHNNNQLIYRHSIVFPSLRNI